MDTADNFAKLYLAVDGYNARFPDGNDPFRIISRLCEEAGELAQVVNHFEGTGVKLRKYGAPDRATLAKEVHDLMRTALCIARYYNIERELAESIDTTVERLRSEGYLQ